MKQDDSQPTGADANNEAPKHDPMDSHFWKVCNNTTDGNEYFDTAVVPVKSDETELIAELRNAKDSDSTKFIRGEIERVGDDFNYGHKWKFKPGTIEIGDFPDDESSGDYCSPNEDIDHWVDVIGKLTIRKKFKTGEEHHRKPKRIPKSSDHLHVMKYDDDEGKFILEDSIRVQGTGDDEFTFIHRCQFGQEFIIVKCETRGADYSAMQAPPVWDTFVFFKEDNGWSRAVNIESLIEGDTTSQLHTSAEGPWPGDTRHGILDESGICQECVLEPIRVSYKLNKNTNKILMHVKQNVLAHFAGHWKTDTVSRSETWFVLELSATGEQKFNVIRSITWDDLVAHRDLVELQAGETENNTEFTEYIKFSLQLDDNDDLLASVHQHHAWNPRRPAPQSHQLSYLYKRTHKSHISKYVYNDTSGAYEHLASGADLFNDIHPADGESGARVGPSDAPWNSEVVPAQVDEVNLRDISGTSLVTTYRMTRWWNNGTAMNNLRSQNYIVFYEMDPETKKYTTAYEHPIDQENGDHILANGLLNVDIEGGVCVISSTDTDSMYFTGSGNYVWFKKTETSWQYMGVLDAFTQEQNHPTSKRSVLVDQDVSFKLSGDFFIACVQDATGSSHANPQFNLPIIRYIIYKLENDTWSVVHVVNPMEEIGYQLGHGDARRPHHKYRDPYAYQDIDAVDWIHVTGDGADRIILT